VGTGSARRGVGRSFKSAINLGFKPATPGCAAQLHGSYPYTTTTTTTTTTIIIIIIIIIMAKLSLCFN
jgi:hypothetical protein